MFAVLDRNYTLHHCDTLAQALIWAFRNDHHSIILYKGHMILTCDIDNIDFRPLHSGWIAAKHLAENRMKEVDLRLAQI